MTHSCVHVNLRMRRSHCGDPLTVPPPPPSGQKKRALFAHTLVYDQITAKVMTFPSAIPSTAVPTYSLSAASMAVDSVWYDDSGGGLCFCCQTQCETSSSTHSFQWKHFVNTARMLTQGPPAKNKTLNRPAQKGWTFPEMPHSGARCTFRRDCFAPWMGHFSCLPGPQWDGGHKDCHNDNSVEL